MRNVVALVILVTIPTVSWGAILEHSPKQKQSTEEKQIRAEPIDQNANQHAIPPERLNKTNDADCRDCEPEKNWWEKLTTDPVASFSGLLVLVTIGLIVVGFRQERRFRDTARKELRAYVALFNVWFEPKREVRGSNRESFPIENEFTNALLIRVKNYGKTPSFDTSIRCRSNINEPIAIGLLNVGDHPGVGKQMLHPGQAFTIQVNEPGTPTSDATGWIWGHFIYRDIHNQWWRTNFFYAHQPKGKFTPENTHNNEKGPFRSESEAFACAEI